MPETLNPPEVRYIKLGSGGAFAKDSFERGIIPLDFKMVDHDLCHVGNWDGVYSQLVKSGRGTKAAKQDVRELKEFYTLPHGTLWITMTAGHLWWAEASGEVTTSEEGIPPRERGTKNGWQRTSLNGTPLTLQSLSSVLTKTASYQRTICKVAAEDYLLRRINDVEHPVHVRAMTLQDELHDVALDMIKLLHWQEFETLVDLIFTRNGWRRTSLLGSTMPDVDLILEQPLTGETAWVQVKTGSTQAELDDYISRFKADGSCNRFIYACASPKAPLMLTGDLKQTHELWTGTTLAQKAVSSGLLDWLITRVK